MKVHLFGDFEYNDMEIFSCPTPTIGTTYMILECIYLT